MGEARQLLAVFEVRRICALKLKHAIAKNLSKALKTCRFELTYLQMRFEVCRL
jgi:hypothetical protein